MAQHRNGFARYLAEKVSVSRWELFKLQFLFFFFMSIGLVSAEATIFEHPARVLILVLSLIMGLLAISLTNYWKDRYGEWVEIVFFSIVFVVLLAIVWYGIERHRHNVLVNAAPYIVHR